MDTDELSPQEAFDLVVSEIQDRMIEYIAMIKAIPEVEPLARVDIWNSAVAKREEIDHLHARLADAEKLLREHAPAAQTPAAALLYAASRSAGWDVPRLNDERVLAHWCQKQTLTIRDPAARQSALEWIRRALIYAQSGRKGPAVTCMSNAGQLLGR